MTSREAAGDALTPKDEQGAAQDEAPEPPDLNEEELREAQRQLARVAQAAEEAPLPPPSPGLLVLSDAPGSGDEEPRPPGSEDEEVDDLGELRSDGTVEESDPGKPQCLRFLSTRSEPVGMRLTGSADILLLRAEEGQRMPSHGSGRGRSSTSPTHRAQSPTNSRGLTREVSIQDEVETRSAGSTEAGKEEIEASKKDEVEVSVSESPPPHRRSEVKASTANPSLLSPTSPLPRRAVRSRTTERLLSNMQALAVELNVRKVRTAELVANAMAQTEGEAAKEKLTSCADPGATFYALARSVLQRDSDKVSELVLSGVSVNMALREEHGGFVHFSTLLHAVCDMPTTEQGEPLEGSVAVIRALILAKANINPRNSRGVTPLMNACRQKNVEVVQLLISHNARVMPCDEDGHSCVNWASALQEDALPFNVLHPRTCFPDDEERSAYLVEMLLVAATQEPESKPMKRMASAAAPTTTSGPNGAVTFSVKRRASMEAETKVQEMNIEDNDLAAYGDILRHQEAGWFPCLRCAVIQGNLSAALVMMECGAQPVWLHDAVAAGHAEIVETLIRFNANPAAQDAQGASAIDVAVQIGADPIIVDLLRQNVHKRRSSGDGSLSLGLPPARGRNSSIISIVSFRSMNQLHPRSVSQRSINLSKGSASRASPVSVQMGEFARWGSQEFQQSAVYRWFSQPSRDLFENRFFQRVMFLCLASALYMPDVYALTDLSYSSLDAIIVCIFLCFVADFLIQVFGFYKTYVCSFFFYMDIIGTASLIVEFSSVRASLQGNAITQNSVVMRATRAAKLGARAGRLTRVVKMLRYLPFSKQGDREAGSTAKVISSRLISRVSSVVACLIIMSVQLLPLPGMLSYPTQDFSIQMWVAHLRRSLEEAPGDVQSAKDLVTEFRAFYDRAAYKPYFFKNASKVLWESRGPLQADRSIRIEDGAVTVYFDFSSIVHIEAATNMSIITITILLMVLFSLLISRAISRHALAPLETMLLKVRKIGRLIWLQVESIHSLISNVKEDPGQTQEGALDETVLLQEVLGKLSLLKALKLIRPDEDAQAVAFLGTGVGNGANLEHSQTLLHREMIQARLQNVVQENLTEMEVPNLTSWRFSPLDLEDLDTKCVVCAKLLSTCMPYAVRAGGVTESEISAFIATVETGYLQVPYHNWNHAVDVMHSVYVLLQHVQKAFSTIERYALLVCAVAHDIQHPGVSNEFLVQTNHELAMRYNDNAPLESMHCARLFEILSDPTTNVWGKLDEGPRKDVRKLSIEAILHTDNGCHFNVVKACQMIHEVHDDVFSKALTMHSTVEAHQESWPPANVSEILAEKETHDTLRNTILHFADISNSMKPFAVARPWALLVLEEFFAQGEKMNELGLPVPPLNDKQKTNRPTSQIGFIEFIVSPLVFTIVKILPPLGYTEQAMWGNVKSWFEEWASSQNPSKSELQQMATRIKSLYEKVTFAKQGTAFLRRSNSI